MDGEADSGAVDEGAAEPPADAAGEPDATAPEPVGATEGAAVGAALGVAAGVGVAGKLGGGGGRVSDGPGVKSESHTYFGPEATPLGALFCDRNMNATMRTPISAMPPMIHAR